MQLGASPFFAGRFCIIEEREKLFRLRKKKAKEKKAVGMK